MEKQQKQQQNNNNLIIKNLKRKALPVELIVNIFNIASDISLNDLNIICHKNCYKIDDKKIEKDQLKKYWNKFVKNILISTKMVNFFVGERIRKNKNFLTMSDFGKQSIACQTEEENNEATELVELLTNQLEHNKKTIESTNNLVFKAREWIAKKKSGSVSEEGKRPLKRSASSSPTKLWYCDVCETTILDASRSRHFVSKTHIDMVKLQNKILPLKAGVSEQQSTSKMD